MTPCPRVPLPAGKPCQFIQEGGQLSPFMLGCSAGGVVLFALAGPLSESLALRVTSGGVLFAAGSVLILAYVLARCDPHGTSPASLPLPYTHATSAALAGRSHCSVHGQRKELYARDAGSTLYGMDNTGLQTACFGTPHPSLVCGNSRLSRLQPFLTTYRHACTPPRHLPPPPTQPNTPPLTHPQAAARASQPGHHQHAAGQQQLGGGALAHRLLAALPVHLHTQPLAAGLRHRHGPAGRRADLPVRRRGEHQAQHTHARGAAAAGAAAAVRGHVDAARSVRGGGGGGAGGQGGEGASTACVKVRAGPGGASLHGATRRALHTVQHPPQS